MTMKLEGLVKQLGTSSDSQDLRDEIRGTRSELGTLVAEIARLLRHPVDPAQKGKRAAIMSELQQVVAKSKRVTEDSVKQEQRAGSVIKGGSGAYRGGYAQPQIQDQEFESKLVEKTQHDIDDAMIRERNKEMQGIHQSLDDLTDVFTDTARYIGEDTEMIHRAQHNASEVLVTAKDSARIINSAKKRMHHSRYKMCCIILILTAAIVVICAVVAIVMGLFSGVA